LLTMLWVTSTYSSLPWYGLRKDIELRDAMCSRLKVTTWGPPPTSGKVDGAVVEVFRRAAAGEGRPPPLPLLLLFSLLSFPFLFSLWWLNVNEEWMREREMAVGFVRGEVLTCGIRSCACVTSQHRACYRCHRALTDSPPRTSSSPPVMDVPS
jgi:hypothetical protein